VDLTLRDGIHLQEAIETAKEIDQKSKASGFNQMALDQMAKQGYGNARFEVSVEEEFDLVEEFYTDELVEAQQVQSEPKGNVQSKFHQGESFVLDIQQELQGSVRKVN
jgi:hypothetical protein